MDAKKRRRSSSKQRVTNQTKETAEPKATEPQGSIDEDRRTMPTLGAIPKVAPEAQHGDLEEETLAASAPYNQSYGLKKE